MPPQNPGVPRELVTARGDHDAPGIGPSQTVCDHLTGLAQQMCYAVEYGVNE